MTSQAYLKGVRKHARELFGIGIIQHMKHIPHMQETYILIMNRKTSES